MSTAGDGGGESPAVLRLLPHRGRTTGCGGSHTGTAVRKTLTGRYSEKFSLVGTLKNSHWQALRKTLTGRYSETLSLVGTTKTLTGRYSENSHW